MKHPEIYALLWLTRDSERALTDFLVANGLRRNAIQRGMHLTVYHAQRSLPGLRLGRRTVDIVVDVAETRLMVMAPGGERPRDGLDPSRQSIGLRLTKRNAAIDDIQALRSDVFRLETPKLLGARKPTNAWNSAFGSRRYQPHVTLAGPQNGAPYDLTVIGKALRTSIATIRFDRFEVRYRPA
ncbi:MAG: hypothetical protein OXG82_08910 [Gammaproteobacteria bacterium]|nr:hypothetical protein [Gammaproteobacteria bacterium]